MRKIPTVFKRNPEDMRHLLPEVTPGCEWVLAGEGTALRKYDGTCCMLDGDGEWWARREVKAGATPPPNFVEIEFDEYTRKTVGWIPMHDSSFKKWHAEAVSDMTQLLAPPYEFKLGTYELCGPKINGNPEKFDQHALIRHADAQVLKIIPAEPSTAEIEFRVFHAWLLSMPYEGIVWHHMDGRMAKLKKRDFS
jgi:hypothetical protein